VNPAPAFGLVGLAALAGLGALLCVAACSSVQQGRIGIDAPDDSELGFGPVADYLDHRCGSLDCHGQIGRNLRIWGCNGMRLDQFDIPSCDRSVFGGNPTTAAEHQATYRSLVGLEPTVMSTVVAGGGREPELLTFVRKARGLETHKGGQLITPGDDQDTCVVSWLAGATNTSACSAALAYPAFPSDASTE
jgi:hypothetical protein